MSATEAILKPDHSTRRRHFIFTEDHERLRESIHAFVVKELQPHADEWELNTFDDWVFPRMGELGLLGLSMPEETAARAATTRATWSSPRSSSTRTAAGWRWGSPSTPT